MAAGLGASAWFFFAASCLRSTQHTRQCIDARGAFVRFAVANLNTSVGNLVLGVPEPPECPSLEFPTAGLAVLV